MANLQIARPDESECGPDFFKYVCLTPDGDIVQILASQLDEMVELLGGVSDSEALVHHAPHTWTLKQVLGHLIDCERIFGYRALRIARGDATPLAGFDENEYMRAVHFNRYPLAELLDEFANVRRSHLLLFRHLEPEAWLRRGIVRGGPASVRAFAYVIAGHARHHLDIIRRRLSAK